MPTTTAAPAPQTGHAPPPGAQGSTFVASDQTGAQTSGAGSSGAGSSGAVRFAMPADRSPAPQASIVEIPDEDMENVSAA